MNELKECTEKMFEDIKHIDEYGNEYWLARELQSTLGYHRWRRFNEVINRAIISYDNSKIEINDHFALYRKMVDIGSETSRSINDLIVRAKVACKESKYNVDDHFAVQRKMIKLAKGATRNINNYKLSRYACYLIVQNGNSHMKVIALI